MKRVKLNKTSIHRPGNNIPPWVVLCLIMIGAFAFCVVIITRTHTEASEASARYQQSINEIGGIKKINAYIAAMARDVRMGQISKVNGSQPEINAIDIEINSASRQRQSSWFLTSLLYCIAAFISGFLTVRFLIALLRAITERLHIRSSRTQRIKGHVHPYDRDTHTIWRLTALLASSLLLAVGFIYAVRQQMLISDYGRKSEVLRLEGYQLLEAQSTQLLDLQESYSPGYIEQSARQLGIRPKLASGCALRKQEKSDETDSSWVPAQTVSWDVRKQILFNYNSTSHEKLSSDDSDSSALFNLPSTSLQWIGLILLTLFGGVIAVISSGLLTQFRSDTNIIKQAPGTTFHCSSTLVETMRFQRKTLVATHF